MFANQQLAHAAAEKEIQEARKRTVAQRALADAQGQAAARALTVAREKAANEAKSEFMSLMCHEVRTPLNGCLASAEMLLETALEVPLPVSFSYAPVLPCPFTQYKVRIILLVQNLSLWYKVSEEHFWHRLHRQSKCKIGVLSQIRGKLADTCQGQSKPSDNAQQVLLITGGALQCSATMKPEN